MLIRPCAHFKEFTVRIAADAVMLRIPQLGFTKLSGTVVIQGKSLEVEDNDSVAIYYIIKGVLKEVITFTERV